MVKDSTVLGADGRPLKRRELTKEIAGPGLTGVRQVWGDSAANGLTPQRLSSILTEASQGQADDYLKIAEEMEERDPHYASVLGVRKRAVGALTPIIEAGASDAKSEEIAEAVREMVDGAQFADLLEDLLDALGKGYSVVEILWKTEGRRWEPRDFVHRDPRWFQFDRETGAELRLRDVAAPVHGLELPSYKFIQHRPRLKTGLSLRGGLARLVAFSWMCKAYTVKDWVSFIELYGLPLRLGRYGPEATKQDRDALMRAVHGIGSDAAAVIPRSMEIEFVEVADGAGYYTFEKLARWVDEQVSKAVLGQTMTADSGSSLSQAQVHDSVRHDILRADARQLSGAINQDLIKAYVDLNFGPQAVYPRLSLPVAEPEDTVALVDSVEKLAKLGVRFKADELRAKLGLTDPEDDDEVIGGAPKAEPKDAPKPGPKELSPDEEDASNRAQPDIGGEKALGDIVADGLDGWRAQVSPLVDPLTQAVANAGSYEDAMAHLEAAAPDMGLGPLVDSLTRMSMRARAVGDGGHG